MKKSHNPLEDYFWSLQNALAKGDATEHTHRPALKVLIEASAPGTTGTNEPKAVERENQPDYIIRKHSSIVGFIEAKDLDKNLIVVQKTDQIRRYLEALPNFILTNYLRFIWFVSGSKRLDVELASLSGTKIHPSERATTNWEDLFTSFLNEVSPTVSTPLQLATSLAGQTRLLQSLVAELLDTGDQDLGSQEAAFKTLLVPDLKVEEFADMYVTCPQS